MIVVKNKTIIIKNNVNFTCSHDTLSLGKLLMKS